MTWNVSGQEEIRLVGGLIKNCAVKVANFVRERVQEERQGRAGVLGAGRDRAGVWI